MLTPAQVLDNYYLEARCMLIEIAATLDRYERANGAPSAGGAADGRVDLLYRSLALLAERKGGADRAERLLNLFSDLD